MIKTLILIAAGLSIVLTPVCSAQTVLVDFNSTTLNNNQSGASGWAIGANSGNIGANTTSNTFTGTALGTFSVQLQGYTTASVNVTTGVISGSPNNNLSLRDRTLTFNSSPATNAYGSGVTNNNVYSDLVFANHIVMTISGLAANSAYDLRVFTWDSNASGMAAQRLYDITAGANMSELGTIIVGGSAYGASVTGTTNPNLYIASNNQSSIASTFTSNSSGEIIVRMSSFGMTGGVINSSFGDNAKISGFELTLVPEPSSYALFCGGLLALVGLRWLRRRQA